MGHRFKQVRSQVVQLLQLKVLNPLRNIEHLNYERRHPLPHVFDHLHIVLLAVAVAIFQVVALPLPVGVGEAAVDESLLVSGVPLDALLVAYGLVVAGVQILELYAQNVAKSLWFPRFALALCLGLSDAAALLLILGSFGFLVGCRGVQLDLAQTTLEGFFVLSVQLAEALLVCEVDAELIREGGIRVFAFGRCAACTSAALSDYHRGLQLGLLEEVQLFVQVVFVHVAVEKEDFVAFLHALEEGHAKHGGCVGLERVKRAEVDHPVADV